MTAANLSVEATIARARKTLEEKPGLDADVRMIVEMLLLIVSAMFQRLGKTSKNSSLPPSSDKNLKVQSKRLSTGRRPGGQFGHPGATLEPVPEPDEIIEHKVSACGNCGKSLAAKAADGIIARQVIDVRMTVVATEHRAEAKVCPCGCRTEAAFPAGVESRVQYGPGVKTLAVYLSQYQLLPYARIEESFRDQFGLPLSAGSVANFNSEAFERLLPFEAEAKAQLGLGPVLNVDETGVRVEKKTAWIHCASNALWTLLAAHSARGLEAMEAIGILPFYLGVMVHDHWKAYFSFDKALHALCNAHHLRELEALWEFERLRWAELMKNLLVDVRDELRATGELAPERQVHWQKQYRKILTQGELESPLSLRPDGSLSKKRTKARCLLDRLRAFEAETLRFMREPSVPFTNNQAERDVRMAKVQQKISGSFRSMDGARIFCRIRSYCSTAKKQGQSPYDAIERLMRTGAWSFTAECLPF